MAVDKVAKGIHLTLYKDGEIKHENMDREAISHDDLLESVRIEISQNSFDDVQEIMIGKNVELSVIKKSPGEKGKSPGFLEG